MRQKRDQEIEDLGFRMGEKPRIDPNQFIFVCCVLLVTVFASFVILPLVWPCGAVFPMWRSFVIGAFIGSTYCIGVICALVTQDPESMRCKKPMDRRPWLHYLLMGVMTALIAAPVYVIINLNWTDLENEVIAKIFILLSPIILLASGSAAFTAFNIDNGVLDRPAWARRFPLERVPEALGQGLAQTVWFCIIWVMLVGSLRQVLDVPLQNSCTWFNVVPIRGVVTHFLVGCAIGWFIPTMYRNAYIVPTESEPNKPEPLADGIVLSMPNKPRPAQ